MSADTTPSQLDRILDRSVQLATDNPEAGARPGQRLLSKEVLANMEGEGHFAGEAATGSGKALDIDTPIPTPTGWTAMGDLRPGDTVFDESGEPTEVLSLDPPRNPG